MRKKLKATRKSITHKAIVGLVEFYITIGLYEDGEPGEVFIKAGDQKAPPDEEEGFVPDKYSNLKGWCDTVGELTSLLLQEQDIKLETICLHLMGKNFIPNGMTRNEEYRFAKSIPDYLGCFLMMTFREQMWNKLRKGIPK